MSTHDEHVPEYPRTLTDLERAVLLLLLPEHGFPGVAAYRKQAEHLTVVAGCPCGCPSIEFAVDEVAAPPSRFPGTPLLPFEAESPDLDNADLPLEVILFARGGVLEGLELVRYGDGPPLARFPPPESVTAVRR